MRWNTLRLAFTPVAVFAMVCNTATSAFNVPADNPSSMPEESMANDAFLYFTADDGIHGREPWLLDKGGKARMLADMMPGPEGSNLINPAAVEGGWYYFMADSVDHGRAMWVYGVEDSQPRPMTWAGVDGTPPWVRLYYVFDGVAYFGAGPGEFNDNLRLYRAPLGADEAAEVFDEDGLSHVLGRPHAIWRKGDVFFGGDFRRGFWRTDFTDAGTHLVREDLCLRSSFADMGDFALVAAFSAHEPTGPELWRTDGTAQGTYLVRDIAPGPQGSMVRYAWGGYYDGGVLFAADDGVHGRELWYTDGTAENTRLVKDINPGFATSDPHRLTALPSCLVFLGDDHEHGCELWRSDGTPAGTFMLRDIYRGSTPSNPWRLCVYKNRVYCGVTDPVGGEEPWVTDGTPKGTHQFVDIVPGPGHSGPHQFTVFNGLLYFSANDGVYGEELWVTDGTPEGTRLAADIARPHYNPSSSPRELTAFGTGAVFVVHTPELGKELWYSDGTARGTLPVKDIAPGPQSSDPRDLVLVGNRLYFTAESPEFGREWWVFEGTPGKTHLLADLVPGPEGAAPAAPLAMGGHLFFFADTATGERALWCIHTHSGDAEELARIEAPGTTVEQLFKMEEGGVWYACCYTKNAEGTYTLWRSGGTPAGTRAVFTFTPPWLDAGINELRALAARGNAPQMACMALLLHPPRAVSKSQAPVDYGGRWCFAWNEPGSGSEPWITDGTLEGTHLLRDLYPGPASSSPLLFMQAIGSVFFTADTPADGRILCRFDDATGVNPVMPWDDGGSQVRSVRALDLTTWRDRLLFVKEVRGASKKLYVELSSLQRIGLADRLSNHGWTFPSGRAFQSIALSGDRLFFLRDDGIHGEELFSGIINGENPPGLVKDILLPGDIRALGPSR